MCVRGVWVMVNKVDAKLMAKGEKVRRSFVRDEAVQLGGKSGQRSVRHPSCDIMKTTWSTWPHFFSKSRCLDVGLSPLAKKQLREDATQPSQKAKKFCRTNIATIHSTQREKFCRSKHCNHCVALLFGVKVRCCVPLPDSHPLVP